MFTDVDTDAGLATVVVIINKKEGDCNLYKMMAQNLPDESWEIPCCGLAWLTASQVSQTSN